MMVTSPYEDLFDINDLAEFETALTRENSKQENQFKFPTIDLNKKQKIIQKLMQILESCNQELCDDKTNPDDRQLYIKTICSCLCAVKILVRDKDSVHAFNNNRLLDMLCEYCGLDEHYYADAQSYDTHRSHQIQSIDRLNVNNTTLNEDLVLASHKCLTNLVYNNSYAQSYLKKLVNPLVQSLKDFDLNSRQINLFNLRLLFLLTTFNRDVWSHLKDTSTSDYCTLELLLQIIDRKLDQIGPRLISSNEIELFVDILKLMYNLSVDVNKKSELDKDLETSLKHAVRIMRKLLLLKSEVSNLSTKQFHLTDLHSNVVNLLTNMTPVCFEELLITRQAGSESCKSLKIDAHGVEALDVLLGFLYTSLESYSSSSNLKLNTYDPNQLQPILLAFILASKSNRTIRQHFRSKILPPMRDEVKLLPSEGKSMRNYLAKLMIHPNTQLKHLSAQLLYVLCKENIGRLMKYTGFGLSAGFLADLGLLLSTSNAQSSKADYSSDSESSDTEEYARLSNKINDVTGRYEPDRTQNLFENLSDEQIDYVTNQLMNNIDKLNNLGIIRPAVVGSDGKPKAIEHVLELTDHLNKQSDDTKSDDDNE